MLQKILGYIIHPSQVFIFLQNRCNFPVLPDEIYLKICYKLAFNKQLDFDNPQTYTEKLQWLKLYDRKPEYTAMVDKYEAKQYVANIIGEEYTVPTLGVWEHFEDIDFDALPDQFVLKCTHDSGGLVICQEKAKMDLAAARKKINKSLKRNYYWCGREWPYKNVKPRIIAEPFLGKDGKTPLDYKVFLFGGAIDSILVCKNRDAADGPNFYFYDPSWNRLYYLRPELEKDDQCPRPQNLDEMLRIAKILGSGFAQIRVDFYDIDGRIYFGELTFFDCSGFDTDTTPDTDLMWGQKVKLPKLEKENDK